MITSFAELISAVQAKPKKNIAVAAPEGSTVMKLVRQAVADNLAAFILVGDETVIRTMAGEFGLDVSQVTIVHIPNQKDAAEEAVRLVVTGAAHAIMKGNLPTAVFMRAVLDKQKGLNDNKVISELTMYEKIKEPAGGGFCYITDCAINVQPTLDEKRQIIENAVNLAHRLGNERPRVAVISAVEVVNPAMPDTVEAAALSKMAERGQIEGCIVDGPLAFDNAISADAAQYKKVGGGVAGQTDIIMAPNLLTANPLRKAITHYSGQRFATAVMGAKAPIVLTSRSDPADTMLLTIVLAAYVS